MSYLPIERVKGVRYVSVFTKSKMYIQRNWNTEIFEGFEELKDDPDEHIPDIRECAEGTVFKFWSERDAFGNKKIKSTGFMKKGKIQ